MQVLIDLINTINGIVWGLPMIILILGTGLYLQFRLGFMPIRKHRRGFRMIWSSRKPGAGSRRRNQPFAALMTALAATVGTGNIAGVATAIALGGPGALFWMWMTALVGMATKYAEVVLAVKYREVDDHGEHVGGPMYAIKNGLGAQLALARHRFAHLRRAGRLRHRQHGPGQRHCRARSTTLRRPGLDHRRGGHVLTGAVIIGGIKRIGTVAEMLVPAMCIGYILCVAVVLFVFADQIPAAFELIFTQPSTRPQRPAASLGSSVMLAMH